MLLLSKISELRWLKHILYLRQDLLDHAINQKRDKRIDNNFKFERVLGLYDTGCNST